MSIKGCARKRVGEYKRRLFAGVASLDETSNRLSQRQLRYYYSWRFDALKSSCS
jgi:hypothetical protein